MMQNRIQSLAESVTNIVVGLVVSWSVTWGLMPLWGFIPSVGDAVQISAMFTVISLARTYVLRRIFNAWAA